MSIQGSGDRLARGEKSAIFTPAIKRSAPTPIKLPKGKQVLFGICKDCNTKTYSAAEFSDHAHACKVNPILWGQSKIEVPKKIVDKTLKAFSENLDRVIES